MVKSTLNSQLKKIVAALEDKKGVDIQVLDVRDLVSYADFLVLCTGTSNPHIGALVSAVKDAFQKGEGPIYVNSSKDDSWWILDFVDIVVHVFKDDLRHFYDMERLWGDAKRVVPS